MEPDIFEKRINVAFNEDQIVKENVLQSTKMKCSICKIGDNRPDGKPTPMIVYGREGVKVLQHQYMRCTTAEYSYVREGQERGQTRPILKINKKTKIC